MPAAVKLRTDFSAGESPAPCKGTTDGRPSSRGLFSLAAVLYGANATIATSVLFPVSCCCPDHRRAMALSTVSVIGNALRLRAVWLR